MKNEIAIIYHVADLDGKLSGSICKHFLSQRGEEVALIPWDYHYKMEASLLAQLEEYKQIFLVDISIPEILEGELRKRTVWIDHHISAIKRFGDKIAGLRIDGVAACRLCYQYFTNKEYMFLEREDFEERKVTESEFLALCGEYDVFFERNDENHFCINFALCNESIQYIEAQFLKWEEKKEENPESLIIEGEHVLSFVKTLGTRSQKFVLTLFGYKFICVNSSISSSLIFDSLPKLHDGFSVFSFIDVGRVKFSIYPHNPDALDGSILSSKMGGGGHAGASGFQLAASELGSYLTKM